MLNSIGNLLSANGVKTSILDVSKNRGLFWFYDKDTSAKAKQLSKCMSNLSAGVANPIQLGKNKNLSMFTAIPGSEEDNRLGYKHRNVVDAASSQCGLLLIDCDFTTPLEYYDLAHEVYVVCDLDLVKGRETVEFLRKLQARGFNWDKLRLIVNNTVSSKITPKVLRDDVLTIYYDANSTFNEDIDEIKEFYSVPMDPANYAVYVESIANSRLGYNQYSENLKKAFEHIAASILRKCTS
jgi:hypothetical protein